MEWARRTVGWAFRGGGGGLDDWESQGTCCQTRYIEALEKKGGEGRGGEGRRGEGRVGEEGRGGGGSSIMNHV